MKSQWSFSSTCTPSPRITWFPLAQFSAYVTVSGGILHQLNLYYGPTNAIFA